MYYPANAPLKTARTLLVLGRVSNLPTVWSNCLAGWLLAGGVNLGRLLICCLGTTFLYLGGMYLNDAFDVNFDRQHRKERPIPSGAIKPSTVWWLGTTWLALGFLSLLYLGKTTGILGFFLVLAILLYDAVHKSFALSPFLMALCRLLLYLTAASTARFGVTGIALWSGIALALYIVGLTHLAGRESIGGPLNYWPVYVLGAPLLLALLLNDGDARFRGAVFSLFLALWVLHCLRYTFWVRDPNVGRSVAGLLAGIVLVDLVLVTPPFSIGILFLLFFVLALLFQRFIPAT